MFVITILAGGEGKRMRSDLPKVLHLFRGKPMLLRVIETARQLQPSKIVVVTGRFHTQIIRTLSQYTDIFGIVFVEQPVPKGTGDAVLHTLPQYGGEDHVLILNGDTPLINAGVLDRFIFNTASTDCAILSAHLEKPRGYGRIVRDSRDNFEEIVEEKDCSPEQRLITEINTGIYFIRANVLHTYIPKITDENVQKEYYLTDIVKLAREYSLGHIIKAHPIDESENHFIRGVNTPEEMADLERYT
jgi:bifunctional UDP-N-acetylglucosamine pyrophosphorylase/glucosamine-1-phosphate N-acetyltransferase